MLPTTLGHPVVLSLHVLTWTSPVGLGYLQSGTQPSIMPKPGTGLSDSLELELQLELQGLRNLQQPRLDQVTGTKFYSLVQVVSMCWLGDGTIRVSQFSGFPRDPDIGFVTHEHAHTHELLS